MAAGADALDGGAGFDTADYLLSPVGLTVDLATPGNNTGEATGDSYTSIEGLRGSAFADILRGNSGNNVLDGQAGADVLDGGDGFDYVSYNTNSTGTGVTASLANPGINTGDAAGDTYISIEGLIGSSVADTLIGDAGDNFLRGQGGADALDGGAGGDYADYSNSPIGITVDLANPLNNTGEAAGDTYVSIERIRGSAFNDVLRGDEHSNTLRGGLGADILDGGSGVDFASYSDSSVGVTASLANPGSNTGEAAGDVYISIEALRGGNFADTLIGDAGDNFLQGGPDGDALDGGSGFDFADYFSAASAVTVDLSTPSNNAGEAAGDTFTAIEGIRGSAFNDTLRGNDGDNSITGGAGDDTLSGGAGDDTLDGGFAGDIDTLILSGNRADYIVTGTPSFMMIADSVAGRDGTDTVFNLEFVQFADGTFAAAEL
jgi:Ca2+-binding RTX toxin-like protein